MILHSSTRTHTVEKSLQRRAQTVLSVAFPFAELRVDAVGGAEQILAVLERALVRRGFRSLVAAQRGAQVSGKLFDVDVPDGTFTEDVSRQVEHRMQQAIDAAIAFSKPDIIHLHGIDFARYTLPEDTPVLATLHLPPAWYPKTIWQLPKNYTLQCVSQAQWHSCPASVRGRITVVENGVLVPDTYEDERDNFALLLSRICPEKNLHTAIDAALRAGLSVVLAGKVYPYQEHVTYFEEMIQPRLGNAVSFVGPVGGTDKARLLARARCLLVPSLAAETSCLVAMEALAFGTPVVAMRSGAIPSIIDDGTTGFLVDDAAGMTNAISQIGYIDRGACRRAARERFGVERMVDSYVNLYEHLIQ